MITLEEFCNLDENSQIKEIYACFGLSIYLMQCFEQQLMNMILIYARVNKIAVNVAEFDEIFEKNKTKTMGKLINSVFEEFEIKEKDRLDIWKLHNTRNYFAHHYFKDKISEWNGIEGRVKMLSEILEVISNTENLDTRLQLYEEPYYEKTKITEELISRIINEYIEGTRKLKHLIYKEKSV